MGYDELGRRVSQTVSNYVSGAWQLAAQRQFVYAGWNLVAVLDGQGNLRQSFGWGTDQSGTWQGAGGVGGLLWLRDHTQQPAATYYSVADGHGNVVGLVNAADGTVAAQYEYGPFGELLRATGPLARANPFRFSTKYFDEETGLVYYGYRYYHPATGRWLSPDPLGEAGGLNLYGFVGNDAINGVDTDGQFPYLAPYYYKAAGFFDSLANRTDNATLAGVYDFVASGFEISAQASNPMAQLRGLLELKEKAGVIYRQERGRCRSVAWSSYAAASYGLGSFLGPTLLAEGIYGVDLVTGEALAASEAWSRALAGGASTMLWVTSPLVGKARPGAEACFVAGTPVATEAGAKEIQHISPGERVWSCNEETGAWELHAAKGIGEGPGAMT